MSSGRWWGLDVHQAGSNVASGQERRTCWEDDDKVACYGRTYTPFMQWLEVLVCAAKGPDFSTCKQEDSQGHVRTCMWIMRGIIRRQAGDWSAIKDWFSNGNWRLRRQTGRPILQSVWRSIGQEGICHLSWSPLALTSNAHWPGRTPLSPIFGGEDIAELCHHDKRAKPRWWWFPDEWVPHGLENQTSWWRQQKHRLLEKANVPARIAKDWHAKQ